MWRLHIRLPAELPTARVIPSCVSMIRWIWTLRRDDFDSTHVRTDESVARHQDAATRFVEKNCPC